MCGIAGFADFKQQSTVEHLQSMAACMAHRGPDGQGDYLAQVAKAQVGFAHARLSIIDLSHAADQPMHYEGLSIVYNGEIYNYNEIREELIALGHTFQTHSDTEVILHGWKEWGEAVIHKWRGMFAVVLLDKEKNELICIRDRSGVKPFYYSFQNDLFLFGSELKNLMAHPCFPKEIDPEAVAAFLQYGYVPAPYSIFRKTHKLLPGHILRLDLNSGKISTTQYWNIYDYYNKPKLKISLPEAIEETERILKEAFDYRMVADVPVGVFLSGGYDSTCVTALLQKGRTEKLKTFTIGTADNKLDEAPFAAEIARYLGTDHTEYYCTVKEALDIIPTLPQYYDEPFADSSAIPTILVSRLAREKVTVALSADAGDEIFAGYNRYDFVSRYGKKLASVPTPLRKLAAATMEAVSSDRIPVLKHKANFHSRYDKVKNLLADPLPGRLLKNITQVFNDAAIQKLMAPPIGLLQTAHDSTELRTDSYDVLSFMMAVDYQTYMADDILQKVDRATMSVSLEGREPFLDQNIVEFAAQLPSDYKYHNGIKKYPLRQIVHQYIPKEMMDRPKSGFAVPVKDWLLKELRPLVFDRLGEDSLSHGLFRKEQVESLLRDFYGGRTEKYLQIWHLLMFQMWYQKWMS